MNYGSHRKTAEIKDHWEYGKYLGKHKKYVYTSGREMGVPRFKLLAHDISKLSPDEWFPYVRF